jgi:putative transposase
MKASKFSDAQKAFILKQGSDGMPVTEICRKAGISQVPFFKWKRKYDGLLPTEMRRLKQLEDENRKLRKVMADLSLTRRCFRTSSAENFEAVRKRKLVDAVRSERGGSIRHACRVFEVDTSTYHYKSRRTVQAGLEQRIKEICQSRVRYTNPLRQVVRGGPALRDRMAAWLRVRFETR